MAKKYCALKYHFFSPKRENIGTLKITVKKVNIMKISKFLLEMLEIIQFLIKMVNSKLIHKNFMYLN